MSSKWPDRLRHALTLRLAVWYGVLFVCSALALMALTYLLLARSLEARDRQIIRSTLDRYATEYQMGGLAALNRAISIDRVEGRHERLFVRVLGNGSQAIFFNIPAGWEDFDLSRLRTGGAREPVWWANLPGLRDRAVLEVASARLRDGTLIQIGRSSGARDELLGHFRSRVAVVFLLIVSIAVAGGALLTYGGLAPLRELAGTVTDIVQTGRLDARVALRGTGDALDALGAQVNVMLDRIQALIGGMRGALDNVAHDLRTPLTRLRNVAESALSSEDPAAARRALEQALEETERLDTMLTTLMDISEAETGTMKLHLSRLRLADIVQDACDLYADLAEDKGLTLETDVPSSIELFADRARLRQVFANLLDNAVKYTPAGGRIGVAVRVTGGSVEVTVTDTGLGIPPEDLDRVWERLYRGDSSRTERGLGLGLSLVKAIVEAHGGHVAVASVPGMGSTFSVVLPQSIA
jgi:signal transduction histidine kinase